MLRTFGRYRRFRTIFLILKYVVVVAERRRKMKEKMGVTRLVNAVGEAEELTFFVHWVAYLHFRRRLAFRLNCIKS